MLICNDCGAVFESPVSIHDPETGTEDQCPACRSTDFDRAKTCRCCGSAYREDKLHEGMCEDCVLESVTQRLAEQYAFDRGILVEFYGACFGSEISYCSVDLMRIMIAAYNNGKNRTAFCRNWIRNTPDTLDDYASWLTEYREDMRCKTKATA